MRLIATLFAKIPKKYHYANFPERYVKKQTEFVEWKTPPYENYQPRTVRYRKRPFYDLDRPWTNDFQDLNAPNQKHPQIYVQPIPEWYMFEGDVVQILRGKDRGKKGTVSYVVRDRNWVCVKGLNLRHALGQRDRNFPGILNSVEAPLLVPRDVTLVDPEDQQPTEIEWRYDDDGNRLRVSVRTGRIIPIPTRAYETKDFKAPEVYKEQPKDTLPEDVNKVTFQPQLKTFEMEIMEQMGIKEDRIPYPMYWY